MKRRFTEDRHVATHEAGHAVAAFVLRLRLREVSINPDPERGAAGSTTLAASAARPPRVRFRLPKAVRDLPPGPRRKFAEQAYRQSAEAEQAIEFNPDTPRNRNYLQGHIMQCYAGSVAVGLLTGRYDRRRADQDGHNVVQDLSRIAGSPEEERAYLTWLWERTKNFMNRPDRLAAVKALANALVKSRVIKDASAERIIEQALRDWRPKAGRQHGPRPPTPDDSCH